ncbi:MAG: tetraacyldisaccharide 4'-kinase, partial [Candidatus Omnitrophota bacterium]|nr:tetraacyldisaccharide 4'-kinase [Candidatus Omnitrophota bacterium]
MWQSIHDAWWRLATQSQPRSFSDALACSALQAGAVAYRAAVALRNAAYDRGLVPQAKLSCPVVSVGNLTVGGTGKTTCVEYIVRKLLAAGRHPAILSRGYGGSTGECWLRSKDGQLLLH